MSDPLNISSARPGRGAGEGAGAPAHEVIYGRLREMVLFGELAPGQAVTIQGLCAELEAGMTPVREAIRRLVAEGALVSSGNRRVGVPELAPRDIDELLLARAALEPMLAEMACAQVDATALETLRQEDAALDKAIAAGDIAAYLRRNHAFHDRLYALADAPILHAIVGGLWLRFGPSMRVVCGRMGTENLPDQHKAILDALTARDGHAAAQAMRADLEQGMAQMRAALGAGKG